MIKAFFTKLIYRCYYALYLLSETGKSGKRRERNNIASSFVAFNNRRVLRKFRGTTLDPDRILILLPHCLQNSFCPFRITTDMGNCKKCGKCVIGQLRTITDERRVSAKVATGGTLARKYIRQIKAKLVIAVACKRDLVSGICDAFPVDVYGIFNEIVNEPCIDTSVSIKDMEAVLDVVCKKESAGFEAR